MPTINQLASISQVNGSAQIPVYDQNNGDARKMSVNTLLDYFQTSFAAPTVATNLYTPGAGFNITVPTPVAEQQWMLIQPAGTLATGTVTLPLNTGVPDGTEVLITSTQTITAFTIALNGATAIFGGVSTLPAGAAVRYRYYLATNSWYNITNETVGINAAIQTFLNNPTSANLLAAMVDETGTGLLVFNTSPTLVTPTITNPTVSTGTFTSPALVTPAIGAATGTSLALSGLATVGTTLGVTGVSTLTGGAVIQGLTVGRGLAAIATNTAAGASALSAITTGSQNTAVGANAAKFIQAADNCVAVGNSALLNATAGNGNTSIGSNTLTSATPGALNTALGDSALFSATGGSNTAIGQGTLMSAAGACVALGKTAGEFETGANAFYVDNQTRGSEAAAKVGSLLYGTFNATASSQTLVVNAALTVKSGLIGAVQVLSGPGAVNLTTSTTSFTSTAAGNALTLADGAQGQIKIIVYIAEAAGGDTGILTPTNLGSATTITFNNVGDAVTLQYVGTDWWVVGFRGAVVA